MKNKITDPFVVIRTTGNVEPVNRGGNIMFATPVITMNERVSPFVQEFKDEQDALKCTQEMIRELREVVYDNTETHDEDYNTSPSSEATKSYHTAWNNSSNAKTSVVHLSTYSPEEVSANLPVVPRNQNEEQTPKSNNPPTAIEHSSSSGEEIMKNLIQFISENKEADDEAPVIKKAVNDRLSSYNLMEKVIHLIHMKIVGEVLYYYNRTQGHFMQLTDVEARRLIMSLCREDVKQCGTPFIVKYVHEFITMNPDLVGDIHDTIHPDYLGFRNGILDLRTFKFMAPTPDIFITNIVDDNYDPATPANCPNFDNFLSGCYDGNQELINRVWEAMGEGWQESGKIFTQYNGLPIHPSSVTSWLRKFTERNGLPHVTPHMLRHTSATMLLMQGVPLKAVSRRLGHTLASTTSDIYGHSLRSVEDIAADKLEAMLSPSSQLKKEDE